MSDLNLPVVQLPSNAVNWHFHRHLFSAVGAVTVSSAAGISLADALESIDPRFDSSVEHPFIIRVNGAVVEPDHWQTAVLSAGDQVVVKPRPFGIETLLIGAALLAVGAAVYSYTQMQGLKTNSGFGSLPEKSPTYDKSLKGNSARLNDPIPAGYGRHRIWPDFASLPYRRYIDGDQWLFNVFSIGLGEYELFKKQIGTTALDNFEYEDQLCQPGEKVTLFAPDVVTSTEVENIELLAPNDEDYDGHSGPYTLSETGTEVTRIEFDFICDGLYRQSTSSEKLKSVTITVNAEYRLIDDDDAPLGTWQSHEYSVTGNTVDAIRKTFGIDVPAGRYETRCIRTSASVDPDSYQVGDDIYWSEVRGIIASDQRYNHAVWALKIKVDSQLSSISDTEFNVVRQRLLPIWTGTQWTEPQATRSAVWAFCDMVKAPYGGKKTDDYLDLPALKALADRKEARGDYFDYNIETSNTLDVALQMMAAAVRGSKIEYNGVYTIVSDEPKLVPDYQFGLLDIAPGSIEIGYNTQELWENDSVLIEYVDAETAQPLEVLCALPGKAGTNPITIKLEGVCSRDQAYRDGMFEAAKMEYRNRTISFKTHRVGDLPDVGSAVRVTGYVSDWGVCGEILETRLDAAAGELRLWLSEPVEFTAGEVHLISLTDAYLQPVGPYVVTAGAQPNVVIMSTEHNADIYTGFMRQRTRFSFGVAEELGKTFLMTGITPNDDNSYTLSGEYYDPRVYQYDDMIDNGTLPVPTPPDIIQADLDQVRGLRAAYTGTSQRPVLNLTWSPVSRAGRYVIEIRYGADGAWQSHETTTALYSKKAVNGGESYIRIAAMSDIIGPWYELDVSIYADGTNALRPATPTGLALTEPFTGLACHIEWDEQIDAGGGFKVAVCTLDGTVKSSVAVKDTFYSYTADQAKVDGVGRAFLLKVWAINMDGDASHEPAEISVQNPQIGALTNIQTADFIESGQITADRPSASDFSAFLVWMSPDQGFTPDETNLVLRSASYVLDIPKTGVQYARIAGVDVWGDDNPAISAEITFTASKIIDSQLNDDLKAAIDSIGGTGEGSLAWQIAQEAAARAQADADEAQARVDALSQEAIDRNAEIIAAVADEAAARGSAIAAEAGTRQSADEALAFDVAALQSTINNPATGLAATASALTETHTLAEQNEQNISSQAGTIASIQSSINDLTISEFNASTNYAVDQLFRYNDVIYQVVATQSQPNATPPNATYYEAKPDYTSLADVVSANSGAIDALNTKTTQTANTLATEAGKVAELQSEITGKASTSALEELLTEVELIDDEVTAQAAKTTALETNLVYEQARTWTREYESIAPNTTRELLYYDGGSLPVSINGLSGGRSDFVFTAVTLGTIGVTQTITRVYHDGTDWIADELSSANATQVPIISIVGGIPVVSHSHGSINYSIRVNGQDNKSAGGLNEANAKAIDQISTLATQTADSLTLEAAKVTDLQTEITGKADSNVLNTQISRIDDAEGAIGLLGQDVTGINTTLEGKASSASVNALTSRVDDVEDELTAQAELISGVQSSIGVNLIPVEYSDPTATDVLPDIWKSSNLTLTPFTHTVDTFALNGRVRVIRTRSTSTNAYLFIDNGDDVEANRISVVPGETYIFSAYARFPNTAAKATSNLQLYLRKYDESGAYTDYDGNNHSLSIGGIHRPSYAWTCPEGTHSVRLRIDHEGFQDNGDPYLDLACFQFEQAKPGQTEPSAWSPGIVSAAAQLALKTNVTETEGRVNAIASATFKVQTRSSDGALVAAGIGAEATGEGSTVLIRADRIGLIGSGTADQLALSVEGGKTVIPNAAIGYLAVKDANVESLKVTKVTGTAAEFQTLLANKLKVTSAMIDDIIQSTNYSSSQGWRIETAGAATFNDVKVRGDVEATSLKANTANIVETLHVADGAITVGASYYDGSTDEFDSDDGEVTVCTLVFNPQGGRTVANVGFIYRPPMRSSNSGTVLYETSGTLWVRFKKDGVTVRTLSMSWSTYGQRPSIPFSYPFIDASPGSSNATYTVTAETSYEDGYRMMEVKQKSMVIDGAKR